MSEKEKYLNDDEKDNYSNSIIKLSEYFNNFTTKNNFDRYVCFAGYLTEVCKKENFGRDELKSCFELCDRPIPKSVSRDINTLIHKGWFAKSSIMNKFYITENGIKQLESLRYVIDKLN